MSIKDLFFSQGWHHQPVIFCCFKAAFIQVDSSMWKVSIQPSQQIFTAQTSSVCSRGKKKTLKRENFFRFTFLSTWDLSSFPTHSSNSCCRPPKSNSKLLHYISPFTFFTPIAEHFWRFKKPLVDFVKSKSENAFCVIEFHALGDE